MMRPSTLVLTGLIATASMQAAEITKEQTDFFEKKIRPILVDNCYKCHSVESGKSRGGLTLDSRDGLLKGGENGSPIKAGDPEKSALLASVRGDDEDAMMPPKKENKRLTAAQISDLTEWIKMGAPDPRTGVAKKLTGLSAEARAHWSYQPVKRSVVPEVKNRAWMSTAVDAFILAKIEEKGMAPSPLADKETLLRRATYDLIGLPPTPAEIESFLTDQDPTAFAKVVDRLLASPHYGERWGRYWLDTARYADTTGDRAARNDDYRYPYAWTYRDYVVRSFNEDKPYDRMVLEQLAADKLTDLKDPRAVAALGFLTVGQRSNNNNDIIDDRIDTVSKAFLGMTVSCARCHDHKFDPIPTTDYYSLHGIFNSTIEPKEKPVIAQSGKAAAGDFDKKLKEIEQSNVDNYFNVVAEQNRLFREKAGSYVYSTMLNRGNASAEDQRKGVEIKTKENLNDVVSQATGRAMRNREVFEPLQAFKDGKWEAIASGKTKLNPIVAAAFVDTKPSSIEDVVETYNKIFKSVDAKCMDFIKASRNAVSESARIEMDPAIVQLASLPLSVSPAYALNTDTVRKESAGWPLALQNRGFRFAAINELKLTHAGGDAHAMVVADSPNPKDSPVFIRGQMDTKGELVPRRFLEVLSGGHPTPFKQGSGRLELAKAIANKNNPLTARVIVNRVWLHHFGEGFVRTPDDLGTMSENPSHPELLDYLSTYLMDQNWSLKKLHKLVMLSKVYQESSFTIPEYEKIDPYNRLLWRANVRRLDFESMRDSLLVFANKLDGTVGGQPVNLTDEPYSTRRSVYGYIDRGNLPELMASFDFSNPQAPNSKRSTTIVPQQALFLMNSPMSIDVARSVMSRPEVVNSRDNLNRVFNIYRILFQRAPKPSEINFALEFVGKEMKAEPQVMAAAKEMTDKAAKKMAERAKREGREMNNAQATIRNKGDYVERKPLTPWESCVHALVLSNEVAYVN